MLTLLIGLFSSILPQGLKMWQDKKDKEHELALLKMQQDAATKLHTEKLAEIEATADIEESKSVYAAYQPMSEYPKTGNRWIDSIGSILIISMNAFNSSVRPGVAYIFTFFYVMQRPSAWSATDSEILFLVLGHFFGNRAMKAVFKKGA